MLSDLDGVLVDSRTPFARSINAALVAHGLASRPEEELYPYLGPPLHATFATLVDGRAELVQSCVDAYRERYRAVGASESVVFEGIRECLAELVRSTPCVVATSKPRALAEPLLEALGLRRFFAAVFGPSLEAEDETKSVTVGRALQFLPSGTRAAIVGDRKFDISAGRAHGIATIGALWGIGSAAELREAGADHLAEAPSALAALLGHRSP